MADGQIMTRTDEMAYDATESAALTAQMNDGKAWHVFSLNGSQSEYEAWVAGLSPDDDASSQVATVAADWSAPETGCGKFDSYEIVLYGQRNTTEGLVEMVRMNASYGQILTARAEGPLTVAPLSSFLGSNPATTRDHLVLVLHDAVEDAENGDHDLAIDRLHNQFIGVMDGVIGGDPTNDVVDDEELQLQLIDAVDDLISDLESAQAACG